MKSLNENPVESAGDKKIWSSILRQVQQTDTKKLPSNRSLLVLGDNDTGKTTLIAKLAGLENPKKGSGLEYNFFEIRDEYRDDSTKLGAWILDGDLKHVNLLNFALTEANLEHSCCILVASMSQPWNIMSSLEIWTDVLERHIESLNISSSKLKQCRQKLLLKFLNYVSPADEAESKLVAGMTNQLRLNDSTNSNNQINTTDADASDLVNESVLSSDVEKEHDYTEETFDFIQQAIRKFCLKFGASLFYVSSKVNKNCDLLHKYLAHRMYDLPFKTAASVVEKDAIFVPAGWDNEKKISILYDNIRSANPDDVPYNDFILESVNSGPTQRDVELDVESDQDFLARIQGDLGKQMPASQPSAPSPVQPRQNLSNPIDTQPSGEGVLQNFFNSLLSKGRTMPPNPNSGQE